jgi:hypothetical protein
MISFQMKMLISTFVFHVIIMIAMNIIFYLNDNQIFDRRCKNKNDDYHDHDEFNENKTIDVNV